jgi:hypothetical protein
MTRSPGRGGEPRKRAPGVQSISRYAPSVGTRAASSLCGTVGTSRRQLRHEATSVDDGGGRGGDAKRPTLKAKQALGSRGGPDQSRGSLRSGPSPHFPALIYGPENDPKSHDIGDSNAGCGFDMRRRAPGHVREADAMMPKLACGRGAAAFAPSRPYSGTHHLVRLLPRCRDAGPPRYRGVQQRKRTPLVHAVRGGRAAASAFF